MANSSFVCSESINPGAIAFTKILHPLHRIVPSLLSSKSTPLLRSHNVNFLDHDTGRRRIPQHTKLNSDSETLTKNYLFRVKKN